MARIRTLKPEFPQSESMGRVSRESRLLFMLLWTIVDDSGRTRANSRLLASLLYPYDDDAAGLIEGWLQELADEGCIILYQAEGNTYLQVTNWAKHQKIDKPTGSKLPSPPQNSRPFENTREDSRGIGEESATDLGKDLGKEEDLGKDQKGAGREFSRGFLPIEAVEHLVQESPEEWRTPEYRQAATDLVEMQHRKHPRSAWDGVQITQNVRAWVMGEFSPEEVIEAMQRASRAGYLIVEPKRRTQRSRGRPLQSEALGEALSELAEEDRQRKRQALTGGAR